jgi:PAS domain S-box-containing protein
VTDDGSRGHQLDLATRGSRPALLDSPVLLAFGYLGGALLCLFLVAQLLHAVFRFPYVILSGGTGAIYLMAVIVVFGTSLLVFGLSRHLALARRTIASRTAERDIAMAGIAIAADGILVADIAKPGAAIIYANRAFEEITGYPAAEAKGKNCRYLQGSDRLQPEIAEIRHAIERGEPVNVTLRNYRKDGGMFWNQLQLAPVRDELGVATHYVGVIRDVTMVREAASRLQYVTDIDRLTSIANRYRYHDRVEKLIKDSGAPCVLVIKADIARFHEINTSFGYQTGDALLIDIAARLSRLRRVRHRG